MKRTTFLFLIFMTVTLAKSSAQTPATVSFDWKTLAALPDPIGFAGSFAGVANETLLVAGGANFPDGGTPWSGSKKVWSDQVFALTTPNGKWTLAGKLPKKLGYGVSINYKNRLIIIGGSNEEGHHTDVLLIDYLKGNLAIEKLPNLPQALANTCGVLLGDVIYVMGGIASADAKTTTNHFWALDLGDKKSTWKVLPTWPGPSRMLSVAGAQAGSIYLFSGVELIDGNRKYLTDAYKFTPALGWEKIADLPNSAAAAPSPAFETGGQLLIFGGDDGVEAPNASTLREKHPGFSKQILAYQCKTNQWIDAGKVFTLKKDDPEHHPNNSIWAPVTTTLTVWKNGIILPGGEVRPATRTPNVLMAIPINPKHH
jgi:N-acetylneuraminate epimerase